MLKIEHILHADCHPVYQKVKATTLWASFGSSFPLLFVLCLQRRISVQGQSFRVLANVQTSWSSAVWQHSTPSASFSGRAQNAPELAPSLFFCRSPHSTNGIVTSCIWSVKNLYFLSLKAYSELNHLYFTPNLALNCHFAFCVLAMASHWSLYSLLSIKQKQGKLKQNLDPIIHCPRPHSGILLHS